MTISILPRYFLLLSTVSIALICIYILLYFIPQTMPDRLFMIGSKQTLSLLLSSSNGSMPRELCQLSLLESDGWFCESDNDWKRRKRLYHLQDRRNRFNDIRHVFFQNNWEPTIQCAYERRVGTMGDGGKWVCDIHKLETYNSTSLIYSIGSSGNFVFEEGVKELIPKAEIHTFDEGYFACRPDLCTFHRAFIGDGQAVGTKSLSQIINKLGHRQRKIDILKIDIEGSEYTALEAFFKHPSKTTNSSDGKDNDHDIPYIRQILIEFHLQIGTVDEPISRVHGLFELFRANNYAIFHKEPNLYNPNNVCEYGFIRLNPTFFNNQS